MRRLLCAFIVLSVGLLPRAQEISLEYHVKAAFLLNFARFVEWPARAQEGPLTICVAGRDPFGPVLNDVIRGETAGGRPLAARVILEPEPGCHMLFAPEGANYGAYLRASRDQPILTVGENAHFIRDGGVIRFVLEGTNVKFAINPAAAARADLRISSRLLRLARIVSDSSSGGTR